MFELELEKFIQSHANWRELLQQPPYNIAIKDDGEYALLKYNQISSDFSNQIVTNNQTPFSVIVSNRGVNSIFHYQPPLTICLIASFKAASLCCSIVGLGFTLYVVTDLDGFTVGFGLLPEASSL